MGGLSLLKEKVGYPYTTLFYDMFHHAAGGDVRPWSDRISQQGKMECALCHTHKPDHADKK
jgi:hypothetical protein